ncbi:MAG: CCA tRNA nucleotidyltransferase [Veillonella sp.]|nr:CCA tRNA nucleotidyltransferase [Veillonella sp.]
MMEQANRILTILEEAGHEAYIIGGAVRDILMHQKPHDFDIVTSARPDTVIEVLRSHDIQTTDLVGKSFGVVVATLEGRQYEIATYRTERYGADSHRPEEIIYADTLEEDVRDIKHKTLRTIGNAQERFEEDALRLFRACRFVAKLDFLPSKELLVAMPKAFHRVSGLSLERVRNEINRLMLEPAVAKGLDVLVQSRLAECSCRVVENGVAREVPILPELYHLVNLPQEKDFHEFDGWYHTLAVVSHTEPDLVLRWGALLHDVAKGMPAVRAVINGRLTDRGHDTLGAEMTETLLTRLGYPKAFVQRVAWIVKNHMRFHYFVQNGDANEKKWLRKEARSGEFRDSQIMRTAWEQLAKVCAADVLGCGKPYSSTDGTLAFGECMADLSLDMPVHTKDLNYDERVIKLAGKQVGEGLQYLLGQVQNGVVPNEPDALYDALDHKLRRPVEK